MKIGRQWEEMNAGYRQLHLEVDGTVVILDMYQKRTLLDRYNILSLGPDFVDKIHIDIPAAPDGSHGAERLDGFTDDPEIVRVYREWLAQYEN